MSRRVQRQAWRRSSSRIENYLGFPDDNSGAELAERAREQASRFTPGKGVGYLDDGTKVIARTSICATGMEYRRLDLPNEERFLSAGMNGSISFA